MLVAGREVAGVVVVVVVVGVVVVVVGGEAVVVVGDAVGSCLPMSEVLNFGYSSTQAPEIQKHQTNNTSFV